MTGDYLFWHFITCFITVMRIKKSGEVSLLALTLHYLFHNCHENKEEWWQVIRYHDTSLLVSYLSWERRDVVTGDYLFWHFITCFITVIRIKRYGDRWLLVNSYHDTSLPFLQLSWARRVVTGDYSFWHFITILITVMRIKKSGDRWLLVLTLHYHSHNCHENKEEWWQVITCSDTSLLVS
jgi:hypothetical protein